MQILFVGSIFVVCLALCVYMAYLAFSEANSPPVEKEKIPKPEMTEGVSQTDANAEALAATQWNNNGVLTISSEDAAKAWEAFKKASDGYEDFYKAALDADRAATEEALALASSKQKPKKKKTTKKKTSKRSKK